MTFEETLAKYGTGKQVSSLYGLFGPDEATFPLFWSFKKHFQWACRHMAFDPEDVPEQLGQAGYDASRMAELGLLDSSCSFVALSVPQLYSAREVVESSCAFPAVLLYHEYLVREKTTGEVLQNELTWLKGGRVLKHQEFLVPEARAVAQRWEEEFDHSSGPSLFPPD